MYCFRKPRFLTFICLSPVWLLLGACQSDARKEHVQAREAPAAPAPDTEQAESPPRVRTEECDPPVPHYRFGGIEPQAGVLGELREFANCLRRTGKDAQTVTLIGRADGRGAADYNRELGARRAERVRDALIDAGLDASRIVVRSRGELEAQGSLRGHPHAEDRRVDILVSDERVTTK